MARWTSSSLRPQINTRAPSRTYAEAIARPIPRLPPLTNATFPSNLSAPLLAIDESLYHSHLSHEIIEDASVLVDFLVVDFGADLRDQPVDGARRGLGCRTLARAAVGARSLLARSERSIRGDFYRSFRRNIFSWHLVSRAAPARLDAARLFSGQSFLFSGA